MFQMIQHFFQQLYVSCNRLYKTVSWEFGKYSFWDWLSLAGLIIFFIIVVAFIIGCFAFIILWPWALLWAINLLFGTAIPLTFWTWLAVFIIAWAWGAFIGTPIIKFTMKK